MYLTILDFDGGTALQVKAKKGKCETISLIRVHPINRKNYSTILLRATCHFRRNTTLFKVALQIRFYFVLYGKMVVDDRCPCNGVILNR